MISKLVGVIVVVMCLLTGCVVSSDHPLPPDPVAGNHVALAGSWLPVNDEDGALYIFPQESDEFDAILFLEGTDDYPDNHWLALRLIPSMLENHTYLSASVWDLNNGEKADEPLFEGEWLIIRYRILDDNRLQTALMDVDSFEAMGSADFPVQALGTGIWHGLLLKAAPQGLARSITSSDVPGLFDEFDDFLVRTDVLDEPLPGDGLSWRERAAWILAGAVEDAVDRATLGGDYVKAANDYARVMAIREPLLEPDDLALASMLLKYADLLKAAGRHGEALDAAERGHKIYAQSDPRAAPIPVPR